MSPPERVPPQAPRRTHFTPAGVFGRGVHGASRGWHRAGSCLRRWAWAGVHRSSNRTLPYAGSDATPGPAAQPNGSSRDERTRHESVCHPRGRPAEHERPRAGWGSGSGAGRRCAGRGDHTRPLRVRQRHLRAAECQGHRPGVCLRACGRHRGRPGGPQPVLRGGGVRRRVADHRRRGHLLARLRFAGVLLHRRGGGRPAQAVGRLGRHRREQVAAVGLVRGRGLQVRGRWQLVAECGPRRVRAHRHDRHPPDRSRYRPRRGAGPAVAVGRRPRPVQNHQRRAELAACPRYLGRHRHQRGPHRPLRSRLRLRDLVPAPASPVDPHRWRAGVGDLSVVRRRRFVGEIRARAPRRRHREDRPGHLAGRPDDGVRDRDRQRRQLGLLPLDQPRRDLGADERVQDLLPPVLQRDHRRSPRSRPGLPARHLYAGQRGWRAHLDRCPHPREACR